MEHTNYKPGIVTDYQNVFRQLPEHKLVISAEEPKFIIEDITNSFATLANVDPAAIIGKPYFKAFPKLTPESSDDDERLLRAFRVVMRRGKPKVMYVFRRDIADPDNEGKMQERYWRVTLYPIFGEGHKVEHILQVASNATQEVLASRELEEARQHLDEALETGKVGSWTWDVSTENIMGNAGLAKVFGVRPSDTRRGLPVDVFLQAIHKDDRERLVETFRRAIETGVIFDTEFRVVARGKTRWVIGRGRLLDYEGVRRLSGVIVDVTERRDLQAQIDLAKQQDRLNRTEARMLKEANDELHAINRTKDEFVALASHQLRTPATAVKQYVGMVLQGYAGDVTPLQSDMLQKAFESNERQIEIINQILNAARADMGKLSLTLAPLDVVALVRGITDELRPAIERQAHRLKVALPKKALLLHADYGYLRMAIENLISNADKYTPEGGTISISIRQTGRIIKLSIKDTGVGIDTADFGKLFVKFSRVHNPLSVQAGGSGIGLYLANEIIRLHAGRIDVASKLNKGTTFTIVLPLQ